jgi:hypothetical protein
MPTTEEYEEMRPPPTTLPIHYHEVQYLYSNCMHRLSLAKNKEDAEFALRLCIPFLLEEVHSQLNPVEQQELQLGVSTLEEQYGDFDYLVQEVLSYV